jgi:hypothetical protein
MALGELKKVLPDPGRVPDLVETIRDRRRAQQSKIV